ncbi:MAG: alpha/beta fold hydrolase [Chloroflexota bacterium]
MSTRHDDNGALSPGRIAMGLLLGGAAAAGGWMLYSALGVDHHMPLPPALNSEQERFAGRMSRYLNAYVDRTASGRPLVLIHSINAAASAYEMRPIFEYYRARRPVYALDLPGYGFSERADRAYSPEVFKEAILDLLRLRVNEPADVVALSLGGEFAALAALEAPELFHSLTLISPTGFSRRERQPGSQQASGNSKSDRLLALFTNRLWSQAFYDLLATRQVIRYYLRKSFVGPVDEGMVEYGHLTAHQPGARHAPLHFISGKLFTPNIRQVAYEKLELPVLVIYDQDPYTNFELLPELVAARRNWQATRIAPSRGLPHFERMPDTANALDAFWLAIERQSV